MYPTASEFGQLLTPKTLKPSASIDGFVCRKLAERWLGHPLQQFWSPGAMDQGTVKQDRAREWYSARFDVDVDTPGFVVNDYGTAGCSPDGMLGMQVPDACGLEIKCPEPDTHVGWLLAGGLPAEHRLQVQGSMWICGCDQWVFLSYHEQLPEFLVTVERDQDVIDAIEEAVGIFWQKFNVGWHKLLEANGGPPAHQSTLE
jgi:hypothetical protein